LSNQNGSHSYRHINQNFFVTKTSIFNFAVAITEDRDSERDDSLGELPKERGIQDFLEETMLPILEFIDENIIGGKTRFEGPYGERRGMAVDRYNCARHVTWHLYEPASSVRRVYKFPACRYI